MDIKKLLSPDKIAVIGASEKEGFGGDTCRNIIQNMQKGTYYFVNPKRNQVFGQKCYPSISSIPENIDLVVICTPQKTVESLLREASEKGVGGAVLYASGYSEMGDDEGKTAEHSLKQLCQSLNIALMGPNCAGYVNYIKGVYPFAFISEKRDRKGSVGVVSQSGQIALSMMDSPKMKFSYAISSGNSNICTVEDYISYLVDDEDTNVIAVYLEGVKDSAKLIDAFKKAAFKRKPIVILKTGRSEKAQEIAASHTGSLSGADKLYDALFKKFGVIRVNDLEELMSTAMAFAILKNIPKNPKVASMNLSGGETAICADLGELNNVTFAHFSKETYTKLVEQLPSYATPNNPLDMTATLSYDADKYAEVLQSVMDDPDVGLVAIGYTLLQDIADPAIHYMAKGMEKVCAGKNVKPLVMVPFGENTRNVEYNEKLAKAGIPVLPTAQYAFKIIKSICDFAAYDPNKYNLDIEVPDIVTTGEGALSEYESKALVKEYGVSFPECVVVKKAEDIKSILKNIPYPIVAKIDSPDILHKSDIGCVKLNLNSEEEVVSAFHEIINNAKEHAKDARIYGVQIMNMVPMGTEMIIGVNNDAELGPFIMCGLGGVFVEIFKDTALSLAPVTYEEAKEMVYSLKGIKMLTGYRGEAPKDVEAFIEQVVNVSKFTCEHKNTLKELDINPIFIYEKGVNAVDALVIKR